MAGAELDEFCRQVQKYITPPVPANAGAAAPAAAAGLSAVSGAGEHPAGDPGVPWGEIIASALRRGTDPLPAIRVIRDKNLSLQKRRAELLAQLGYPEDYLSEKPRCTLWRGYRLPGRRPVQLPEKILCTGADPGS